MMGIREIPDGECTFTMKTAKGVWVYKGLVQDVQMDTQTNCLSDIDRYFRRAESIAPATVRTIIVWADTPKMTFYPSKETRDEPKQ